MLRMSGVKSPFLWVSIVLILAALAGCRATPADGIGGHSKQNRPLPTHLGALFEHPTEIQAEEIWMTLPIAWRDRLRVRSSRIEKKGSGSDRIWILSGPCRVKIEQLVVLADRCLIKWIDGEPSMHLASLVAQGDVTLRFAGHRVHSSTLLIDATTLQYQGEVTARFGRDANATSR